MEATQAKQWGVWNIYVRSHSIVFEKDRSGCLCIFFFDSKRILVRLPKRLGVEFSQSDRIFFALADVQKRLVTDVESRRLRIGSRDVLANNISEAATLMRVNIGICG
jgi:hypothetical protein